MFFQKLITTVELRERLTCCMLSIPSVIDALCLAAVSCLSTVDAIQISDIRVVEPFDLLMEEALQFLQMGSGKGVQHVYAVTFDSIPDILSLAAAHDRPVRFLRW